MYKKLAALVLAAALLCSCSARVTVQRFLSYADTES